MSQNMSFIAVTSALALLKVYIYVKLKEILIFMLKEITLIISMG